MKPLSHSRLLSPHQKIHNLMTSEKFNKSNVDDYNTWKGSLEQEESFFLEGRQQEKLLGVNSGGKRLSAEGGMHYWKDEKPSLFHGLCHVPGRCDVYL